MKKSKFAKIISMTLAFLLLSQILTACGGKKGGETNQGGNETTGGYVYVPEYFELEDVVGDMMYVCYSNDMIYFSAYGVIGQAEPGEGDDGEVTIPIEPRPLDTEAAVETTTEVTEEVTTEATSDPVDEAAKSVTTASEVSIMPVESEWEGMYDIYGTILYSANLDGTGVTKLTGYKVPEIPEGLEGNINLNYMTLDAEGNIWVCESGYFYHYDLPEGWDETQGDIWNYYVDDGQQNFIRKLDKNGAEISQFDIGFITENEEYFYLRSIEMDKAGNVFIISDQKVYAISPEGQQLFVLEVPTYVNSIVSLGDGSIGVMTYEETKGTQVLKLVDTATKGWGATVDLPLNIYNLYKGNAEYSFYYSDNSNFYGYDATTKEAVKILNWINCDINQDSLRTVVPLQDGRILCFTYNWYNGTSSYEMSMLSKKPASEVPEKIKLTMACMYLDYTLRGEIINYNKTNGKYRIEVSDYSEYNTEDDYNAGLTKLSAEIISGKVPDMLCTNNLPIRQYASKGLLEDLYPYLDADSELGRDKLMESVIKAMEIDGKLYETSSSFYVQTVIGSTNVVGEEMGWNMDEVNALLKAHPEASLFEPYYTRDSILNQFCYLSMDDYVNWETGEVSFDSDEFIKLLEFSNTFPVEYDWEKDGYVDEMELIQSGKQLCKFLYASSFNDFQMYKAMFGGEVTFKGYPSKNRDGNVVYMNSGIAMSSKCVDKQGAWEFMRNQFTEDYQTNNLYWNFPTNKAAFNTKLEEAMKQEYYTDEYGVEQPVSNASIGYGNFTYEIYALTQEEADQFMELINSVKRTASYDEKIMQIVTEESAEYFAGQKSAKDTAALIQSRVNIYVNEQR